MDFVKEVSNWILFEIGEIIQSTNEEEIEKMLNLIIESRDNKILIIGSGRSGLVGRAFAMRLMNLGFMVYVSGETISPALVPNDLVIAVSGSGKTRTVVTQADAAKEIGAKILAITSYSDSPLANDAYDVVVVKGRTKEDIDIDYYRRQITGEYDMAPLGTMFELSTMVFLDCVIAALMKRLDKKEIDLKQRHSNAE
jgi:6-phospho-3-hexuloisomerase